MIYLLIKKNVPNLLVENRAKTGTNMAKPTRTPQGHAHSCRRRSKGHKMTSTTQTQPNGDPLRQTIRSPTPAEEKKPRLLWEEQTRDASAKVKKPHSTRPLAKSDPRHADDQRREPPHRPHDTRSKTLKADDISEPPPRLSSTLSRPARSTKTTLRGRRPDIPPLALELQRCTTQPPCTIGPRSHHFPRPPPRCTTTFRGHCSDVHQP